MRILVGWDNPEEAELLKLYLAGTSDHEVTLTGDATEFLKLAGGSDWGAALLALTFPKTVEEGFATFLALQRVSPGIPLVMGCRPTEMISLPKFLNNGLHFYVFRDER